MDTKDNAELKRKKEKDVEEERVKNFKDDLNTKGEIEEERKRKELVEVGKMKQEEEHKKK